MQTTKQEKKIIMKFITHYDLQNDNNKTLLRNYFLAETGLGTNTFYYKKKHQNYNRVEIKVLSELLPKKKKDE